VADINERLDRLQRRQEFDRFGRPQRPAPTEMPVGPVVARPAGVDDRLGEVLDAVAAVVCRHPGLSVMVALADGRAGRPVIRVTEREGGVETGVVVVGSAPPRAVEQTPPTAAAQTRDPALEPVRDTAAAEYGPYDGLSTPTAAPTRESVPGSDPVFEPALRDGPPSRDATQARTASANGRHAAAPREERPAAVWSGSSWHDALWSPGSRSRFRPGEQDPRRAAEERAPATPGSTIPLPEDTSQVVSRLAQLLRENPTLTASWSREAPE
jgi:hypothetical protein